MEIFAALLGGTGLFVGSFLGLVSLRLPRGENVVFGRSSCGGCGRALKPWRMIPVLSWALAWGCCQDCGSSIPRRYPLIEVGAGLIGVWAGLHSADLATAVMTAVLGWQLLLIALIDAEHFQLPDQLTLPLFATGVLAAVVLHPAGAPSALPSALAAPLIGAAVGFGGLWLLAWAYRRVRGREGLGGGDPFLLGAGGAWVGWIGLSSVLLWTSMAGLSVAAGAQAVHRHVSGSDRLPFGAFLTIGLWLTWLYGPLGLA